MSYNRLRLFSLGLATWDDSRKAAYPEGAANAK